MKRRVWVVVLMMAAALPFAGPVAADNGQAVFAAWKAGEKKTEEVLQNFYMVQEMTERDEGMQQSIRVSIWQKGKKRRMEQEVIRSSNPMAPAGQKTVVIDDGTTMSMFHPMLGMQQMPSEMETDEDAPIAVRYLRKETFAGETCDVIAVVAEAGTEDHCWISRNGHVLLKREEKGYDPVTVVIHSDFHKVKGVRFPYKSETFAGNTVVMSMTLKTLDLKKKMTASFFDPETVKGYKKAEMPRVGEETRNRIQLMGQLIGLQTEIQELYSQGKTEEAKAKEKELEALGAVLQALE